MSVYDISVKSVDGEDNFLENFKGKVTLFTNVTGDCGNAPQYAVLETVYRKYKDFGFEIVAVPTSDYCGPNLTYGEHVYGTENGKEAENFAKDRYGVTYGFTEIMGSYPDPEEIIPGLPSKYGKVVTHPLFLKLNNVGELFESTMKGNFMKYLVDSNGELVKSYSNGALLHYSQDNFSSGRNNSTSGDASAAYEELCKDIESLLGI